MSADAGVVEVATFEIRPGDEESFVAAYRLARDLLAATEGFRSARMTRGVESPSTFILLAEWESVDAHEINFRGSDRFPRWRELIGPYFAVPPQVGHFADV